MLVRRGEILLDSSTINNWKQELKQPNKAKGCRRTTPLPKPTHHATRPHQNPLPPTIQTTRRLHQSTRKTRRGTTSTRVHHNMQKNKQAQHKPRRNLAQIHKPRNSGGFIRQGIKVHNGGDCIRKAWKVKGEGLSKNTLRRQHQDKAGRIHACM